MNLCKKLQVSDAVKNDFREMLDKVYTHVLAKYTVQVEDAYWSVEETGIHTCVFKQISDNKAQDLFCPFLSSWDDCVANVPGFVEFFQKYRLKNYFGSTSDRAVCTHRHISPLGLAADGSVRIEPSSWNIVVMNNYGKFKVFEDAEYDDPLEIVGFGPGKDTSGKDIPEWHSYGDLPKGVNAKLVCEIETVPGDLLFFNGWDWHTFEEYDVDNHRTTQLWARYAITERQARSYIKFIESL